MDSSLALWRRRRIRLSVVPFHSANPASTPRGWRGRGWRGRGCRLYDLSRIPLQLLEDGQGGGFMTSLASLSILIYQYTSYNSSLMRGRRILIRFINSWQKEKENSSPIRLSKPVAQALPLSTAQKKKNALAVTATWLA
jgi:hypothetical protein